jgi:signal transduction histidine kinase
MTDAEPQKLSLLAKLIIALILVLIVAGIVWHGVSIPTFRRIWHQLIDRADAPMRFRFILQPLMAAFLAIRHGLNDARTGRSPYFWTMLGNPRERAQRLNEGLNATARIIFLGLLMDAIYQVIVLRRFYPAEAVIVALLFAFIAYVIIRGPATRIARRWLRASPHQTS